MYVIMWEYRVRAAQLIEFEKNYGSDGVWTTLFRKGNGYINTELLRDEKNPHRYITIDRWDSAESYQAFHVQFQKEYETLDTQCEALTEHETLLGKWKSANQETR